MPKEEQKRLIFRFCQGLSQIKKPEEAAAFITDLLSESEAAMLARRLKIAQELLAGKRYESIIEKLNVGFGTVARVSEWLKISGNGYKIVLERLGKILEIDSKTIRMSAMERRYPQYYWPQILLKEIIAGASVRQKNRLQKIIERLPQKSQLHKELSALFARRTH